MLGKDAEPEVDTTMVIDAETAVTGGAGAGAGAGDSATGTMARQAATAQDAHSILKDKLHRGIIPRALDEAFHTAMLDEDHR